MTGSSWPSLPDATSSPFNSLTTAHDSATGVSTGRGTSHARGRVEDRLAGMSPGRTFLRQLVQPRLLLADERHIDSSEELGVAADSLYAERVRQRDGETTSSEREGSVRTTSSFLTRSCRVVRNGAIELSGSLAVRLERQCLRLRLKRLVRPKGGERTRCGRARGRASLSWAVE